MIALLPTPRLRTIPACPSCREPMQQLHVAPDHGRPGRSHLICRGCGIEDRHSVEAPRAVDKTFFHEVAV